MCGNCCACVCSKIQMEVNEGEQLPNSSNNTPNNLTQKKRNKRKKKKNKPKHQSVHKDTTSKRWPSNGNLQMASWAETYTRVATWRFKHEIAYWKAKARSLEYENKLLHEIIRSNHMIQNAPSVHDSSSEAETDMEQHRTEPQEEHVENVEVSEEFIEFLAANAKYREEARLERERLKADSDSETALAATKRMEAPPKSEEDNFEVKKKLYGKDWQRIVALETTSQSQFMANCDKLKPNYWPNIPFNFNFS